MSTEHTDIPQQVFIRVDVDKLMEDELARLIGTTPKALERKRQRRVIPEGVWATIDGRIMYSLKRYDAWVESLWPDSPRELKSSAGTFASASPGTDAGAAKRSRTPRPRKASKQQPVYVLQ